MRSELNAESGDEDTEDNEDQIEDSPPEVEVKVHETVKSLILS